jgi:hypothetical protein
VRQRCCAEILGLKLELGLALTPRVPVAEALWGSALVERSRYLHGRSICTEQINVTGVNFFLSSFVRSTSDMGADLTSTRLCVARCFSRLCRVVVAHAVNCPRASHPRLVPLPLDPSLHTSECPGCTSLPFLDSRSVHQGNVCP